MDRFKREYVKLFVAFSPFAIIPGSFIWYFPILVGLSYGFPKYIMPAHYMRGKNSRNYYQQLHNWRAATHRYPLNNLDNMAYKFIVPPVVSDILNTIDGNKIPDPEKLLKLQEYISKEERMNLDKLDNEVIKAYSKSLLQWSFAVPIFSERNLKRRLLSIVYLDEHLRQNQELIDKLSEGQLKEAVFIRGCNGYEPNRTAEANRYWLRSWLKMTEHIDPLYFRYNEDEREYVALLSILWSTNFNNSSYQATGPINQEFSQGSFETHQRTDEKIKFMNRKHGGSGETKRKHRSWNPQELKRNRVDQIASFLRAKFGREDKMKEAKEDSDKLKFEERKNSEDK